MSMSDRIKLAVGDITGLSVDAVVTAANEGLRGGGGVDGAVHRAAGPGLLEECRRLGGCPAGEARITGGHLLKTKHVIHAVGPIYQDGSFGETEILRSAYRSALALAKEHAIKSIAFPCIATGVYAFPNPEACHIAVSAVVAWLQNHALPERVVFCCFQQVDVDLYRDHLTEQGFSGFLESD